MKEVWDSVRLYLDLIMRGKIYYQLPEGTFAIDAEGKYWEYDFKRKEWIAVDKLPSR